MKLENRRDAGQKLAERLKKMNLQEPMVVALPRGGVPLAYEIARAFGVNFEVLVVRKIGAPFQPEYGIGAMTEGGYYWIDKEAALAVGATEEEIQKIVEKEYRELTRRIELYRDGRSLSSVKGETVIVVDDGLATGVTARVACHYLKAQGAKKVILAVPVCSPRTANLLRAEIDEVICLEEPEFFRSVGQFYNDFTQTTDEEVIRLLGMREVKEVDISDGAGTSLPGSLMVPPAAKGMVIFAHGSGSSRLSPRNQQVARVLNEAGFGTLLFDLLTPSEAADRANVFDVPFLANRLVIATRWLKNWLKTQEKSKDLPIGYFGASTGGGAALWAAAELKNEIAAVVSRGGRPDMAIRRLPEVTAPTLLIVGGFDESVIQLNRQAMKYLSTSKLILIPEAGHVFEEPGKLEAVAKEAVAWFLEHLSKKTKSTDSVVRAIQTHAKAIQEPRDLHSLINEISKAKIVMLGEASHGTAEFYEWRRIISERLISEHGFNFIAVEGDWPPCFELNQFVTDHSGQDAREVLKEFKRWPTWMWANTEIIKLANWMRNHNLTQSTDKRAGFFGLDVYSLFESIDSILKQIDQISPVLAREAKFRYSCFEPFRRNELAYAKSLIQFPEGCEKQVLDNLQDLLKLRLDGMVKQGEVLFDVQQNARVVANAESYYRALVNADDQSWNIRDRHMTETLDQLLAHHGPNAKAIVWAHNTHVGDYRATDMIHNGQINIGGLAREKWGEENVALVGFGTYQGEVTASHSWDGPIETLPVPPAREDSYEFAFHKAAESLETEKLFLLLRNQGVRNEALAEVRGHRAIGVVYHPQYERRGNYVPTSLSSRYDAFIFIDKTTALTPLKQKFARKEIPETWPLGQ